ncbi:MAG: NADH-plastoquinone oxidoreductase subunit [Candidatus Methanolliviera sp. GoM_oil]|nr:MAG: NADH-plastoquinone oxidoreductase subunit [Candidatus Methanolliviera sp. GoM_oil]
MSKIIINPDLCKICDICILSCPMNIFIQKEEDSIPEVTHEEMCISCGHCVAICPGDAISHKSFPEGSIKPVNQDIRSCPLSTEKIYLPEGHITFWGWECT